MMELRCDFKLHGIVDLDEEVVEFRCRSTMCGYRPGVIVLHKFDLHTGKMVDTLVFRDPKGKEIRE